MEFYLPVDGFTEQIPYFKRRNMKGMVFRLQRVAAQIVEEIDGIDSDIRICSNDAHVSVLLCC